MPTHLHTFSAPPSTLPGTSAPKDTSNESAQNEIEQLDSITFQLDAASNSLDLSGANPMLSTFFGMAQGPFEAARYYYSGDRTDLLQGSLTFGISGLTLYGFAVAFGVITAPVWAPSLPVVIFTVIVLGGVKYIYLK